MPFTLIKSKRIIYIKSKSVISAKYRKRPIYINPKIIRKFLFALSIWKITLLMYNGEDTNGKFVTSYR